MTKAATSCIFHQNIKALGDEWMTITGITSVEEIGCGVSGKSCVHLFFLEVK
jgi:hypothetical protein